MSSPDSIPIHGVPLEGRLSDPATLPRLLAWLARGEWSGMVVLRAADVERRLYFAEGRLSTAGSNDSSDALATHLIREGLISEEDRSRAAGQLRTTDRGWSFGRQLVKLGLLSEHDLSRAERRRVLSIAQAAIGLRSGQYACESGTVAGDAMPNQALEVPRVVAEGMLTTWDANSALDVLGGRGAMLDLVTETLSDYEATGAAEEYDATFLRCNGKRSVQQVLDMSPLPEAAALRFLAALRLMGCLSSVPGVAPEYDPEATVPSEKVPDGVKSVRLDEVAEPSGAVSGVSDFEAARAEAIAPAAGTRAADTKSAGTTPVGAKADSKADSKAGAARMKAAKTGETTAPSRLGTIFVVVISIVLLLGAGYIAWRGWSEISSVPLDGP